jgi:ribosomal protein S18 acetylase RimI-like enzyme
MRYFVAEEAGTISGFILWTEKSGFRTEVILELEQLGVLPEKQGLGIGETLIRKSLPLVADELVKRGARVKAVLITTRSDNDAQRLYRKALGAEVEATISNLYSGDEVIMVARNPHIA